MNELLERYKLVMAGWPQQVDEDAVNRALMDHVREIGGKQHRAVRLLPPHVDVAATTAVSVALAAGNTAAARAARAALVAAAARAARAALVAGDALAARAALVADARAGPAPAALVAAAAPAARAPLVAGDAITPIAARDANDVSFAAASRAALA